MSWLARSIANSLKLDEEDEDDNNNTGTNQSPSLSSVSESQSPRGVKEDISELTKTLRSQFWGVASFLSPPTEDLQERNQSPDRDGEDDEDLISGIKNDFAEIGGRFRTGISKLSGNVHVSEFTKIASNFLQLGSESVDPKDYESIGITEEFVAFVKNLAMNPDNWLDFPLPDEDDEDNNFNEFEMTDAQHEHALAMERLVPSLASLRIELCPEYMNESCFWKIYFVLVHSKLIHNDNASSQVEEGESSSKANVAIIEPLVESVKTVNPDTETEKFPVDESKETEVVEKSVIEERNNNTSIASSSSNSSKVINVQVEEDEEDDDDDWLNEEEEVTSGSVKRATTTNGEDEEDVSFSDLEEDDDEGDKKVSNAGSSDSSSSKYSTDWVKLKHDEILM